MLLPSTNNFGAANSKNFQRVTLDELIVYLGLVYSMEIVKLPQREMYWADLKSKVIPNMKFGDYMARDRFREISRFLQFSNGSEEKQVLEFLEAVNQNLQEAVTGGDILTLDESMIKAYHKDLLGKIKIKRKPRPIGNELKDLSDGKVISSSTSRCMRGKLPCN